MKKGFLKKMGALALGIFMITSTTIGLSACHLLPDDDNNHEIVTPDPDDPVIDPGDPTIDPDDPSVDPDDPTIDPDDPTIDPDDPVTEPDEPVTEPDDPVIEPGDPVVDPDPEPDLPTLDEIEKAYDSIEGYEVTPNGADFVRDEYGDPIIVFKHDELYETVENFLKTKTMTSTNLTTLYDNYYSKFSTVKHLLTNYSDEDHKYTIMSLCEYDEPETENDKCLKIVEIPMNLTANSFNKLEDDLFALRPLDITRTEYDYKVSNIDYADGYIPNGSEYTDKEFLDACVNVVFPNSSIKYRLVLFEQHISLPAGDNLGIQRRIPFTILTLEDNKIYLEKKEIRSSSQFGNWVENVINYEENKSNGNNWVVIYDTQSKTNKVNLEEFVYNEALVDKIADAQINSSNEMIL